ncbi:uncharacterized protein LOC118566186 [Fundulus heteroclitus]|uniref:uncharacterized protein LOC118566186 n=1 Tax=Fundulus heteroclitus TaxID=8078 RepID=UPI00165B49FD|nr:uncharacterized protein LOC118566186 [Fundulus heteroclitus]
MFHLTAAADGQGLTLTVRVGDEVTLSCGNVKYTWNYCESITWIFSYNSQTVGLFETGQIHKDAAAKSDRLSVTADCSLVIKKVSVEDVGIYTCRQFINGQPGPDYFIYLSVVNMVKQNQKDKILLICSVMEYGRCRHTVEWLKEGTEEKFSDQEKSGQSCSATVTFPASVHNSESNLPPFLKCKVTHSYTNEVQMFDFRLRSSGGRTDSTSTTTKQATIKTITTTQPPTTKSTRRSPTKTITTATTTQPASTTSTTTTAEPSMAFDEGKLTGRGDEREGDDMQQRQQIPNATPGINCRPFNCLINDRYDKINDENNNYYYDYQTYFNNYNKNDTSGA